MKHSVAHDLGKEAARKAAVSAFESYKERYGKYHPTATWSGDRADVTFTAKGMTLKGSLEVKDQSVEMDLDVPFFLRPFKELALGAVEKEIAVWIDRAKRGEV